MAPRMTMPRPTAPNSDAAPKGRDRFGLSSAGGPQRTGFGALGAVVGLLVITLAVGGIVWTAATGKAPPSLRPRIFGGSLVLDDYRPLTVIDLATGQVTVQLEGIYAQVGAMNYGGVEAVATSAGTTLVNRSTGTFNMLGKDDYVLGPLSNGISLGRSRGKPGPPGSQPELPRTSSAMARRAPSRWSTRQRPWRGRRPWPTAEDVLSARSVSSSSPAGSPIYPVASA